MRSHEFITEGLNHPVIVVDVQPSYASDSPEVAETSEQIVNFVNKQTGPVLMFVNAEQDGLTEDTIQSIKEYWDIIVQGVGEDDYGDEDKYNEDSIESNINWNRFTIVDKGYGYLRAWMDNGISSATIIRVIRTLYANKVNDTRQLFGGDDSDTYEEEMRNLVGQEYQDWMLSDPLTTEWISVAQLKKFNGAYIVGGGRDECLREVELLMNAFNVKYKRIDSLIYG